MWSQALAGSSALTSRKLCLRLAGIGTQNQAAVSRAGGHCGDVGCSNLVCGRRSWWEHREDHYCDLAYLELSCLRVVSACAKSPC